MCVCVCVCVCVYFLLPLCCSCQGVCGVWGVPTCFIVFLLLFSTVHYSFTLTHTKQVPHFPYSCLCWVKNRIIKGHIIHRNNKKTVKQLSGLKQNKQTKQKESSRVILHTKTTTRTLRKTKQNKNIKKRRKKREKKKESLPVVSHTKELFLRLRPLPKVSIFSICISSLNKQTSDYNTRTYHNRRHRYKHRHQPAPVCSECFHASFTSLQVRRCSRLYSPTQNFVAKETKLESCFLHSLVTLLPAIKHSPCYLALDAALHGGGVLKCFPR